MEIKITEQEYGKIVERVDDNPVVTVVLGNYNPKKLKSFKCINCGRIVFNYYSEVRIIIVGEMRYISRPVDIMCSRDGCGYIFRVS